MWRLKNNFLPMLLLLLAVGLISFTTELPLLKSAAAAPFTSPLATPPPGQPQTNAGADDFLHFSPGRLTLHVGGIGISHIQRVEAATLHSLSLRLRFDPTQVTVLDADPTETDVQLVINPLLLEQGVIIARQQVDNSAGLIELTLIQLEAAPTVTDIAAIVWHGQRPGLTELRLIDIEITTQQGQLALDTLTSQLEIQQTETPPVFGRILLQGRRTFEDTSVFLLPNPCTGQPPPQAQPTGRTTPEGFFEVIPPADTPFRCLTVVQRGYLVGQKEAPQGDVGRLLLPGGDVNNDNRINIFDMAYIGSRYGDADEAGDINKDGVVSIFDLVLAAGNFGRRGPVTDWQ